MRTRCLLVAALMILCPRLVPAQDQSTVFVHGLRGSAETWRQAADRLRQSLTITTHVPEVPWAQTFETQAGTLQGQLGSLPSSTIAIGHSNGGVVSRQWSRHRNLAGVMTVGSPLRGAPLVDNILSALGFHESVYNAAAVAFGALGAQPNQWWDVYVYVELALRFAQNAAANNYYAIAGLGVLSQYPVVPQMSTRSSFLGQMNSSSNLAREASTIRTRVGIMYELQGYWRMGPLRVLDPVAAEVWYSRVWYAIATLETAGAYLMTNYPSNLTALSIASRLFSTASLLRRIDPAWCQAVTNDASCNTPHDGVVPVWSQQYPGASNLYVYGPSHLQEPRVSDEVIRYGLTAYMGVAPRSGSGPRPGPAASDTLASGESLQPGQSRRSANGEFELVYQHDGNLVLYRTSTGDALWASHTYDAGQVAMQGDGNLVVYGSGGRPLWASDTAGYGGARLVVQGDGNLVIYDAHDYPIWARQ